MNVVIRLETSTGTKTTQYRNVDVAHDGAFIKLTGKSFCTIIFLTAGSVVEMAGD